MTSEEEGGLSDNNHIDVPDNEMGGVNSPLPTILPPIAAAEPQRPQATINYYTIESGRPRVVERILGPVQKSFAASMSEGRAGLGIAFCHCRLDGGNGVVFTRLFVNKSLRAAVSRQLPQDPNLLRGSPRVTRRMGRQKDGLQVLGHDSAMQSLALQLMQLRHCPDI